MEQNFEKYLEKLRANQIIELKLIDQEITDTHIIALAESLKANQTLTTLCLNCNGIGDEGVQALSEALKDNQTLTCLDLSSNGIGDEGSQVLSEALKDNQTLTCLDLSCNGIETKGAQALSEMLKVNASITALDLGFNQIGDKGAQLLSEALKVNRILKTLDLNYNGVCDKGAQAFSAALKINQILTTLKLGSDAFSIPDIQAINQALQSNIALIRTRRNQTLLTLVIFLRHANSLESKLPFEIWEIIIKQLDFPSEINGYRTSENLASFLAQKDILTEFNKRLQTQQSFRLVETHGAKLGESRFSFLAPIKRKHTSEIDFQPDEQPLLKKAKLS